MSWMMRERRTAHLVRMCWDRVRRGAGPERLHALCRLTWITKTPDAEVADDSTGAVSAPALSAILGTRLRATTRKELVEELRRLGAPGALVKAATPPIGIVNLYNAFRDVSLTWMRKHQVAVRKIIRTARSLRTDRQARRLYSQLSKLPPIPRAKGNPMPAANLLTPVVACLDPRERSPILNGLDSVRAKLRALGLSRATLVEQFDGLVGVLQQYGIEGAFALDAMSAEDLARAKKKAGGRPTKSKPGSNGTPLEHQESRDLKVLLKGLTRKHRQLHRKMSNALRELCRRKGLAVDRGNDQDFMYDALIRSYRRDERDLLIEIKSSDSQAFSRLALGQLYDYRRGLPNRAGTDLAVLFPRRPRSQARGLFDDAGVRVLWFGRAMTSIPSLA